MNGDSDITLTIVLLVMAVIMMVVSYIMLAFMKKSKLKKLSEESDPKTEAYNQLQMLKAMVRVMKERNKDTTPVENMIKKAEKAYSMENYAECIEIVNNAKRVLTRIREEQVVDDGISPRVAEEMRIIKKIEESAPKDAELPTPLRELEKDLPENFLQSKFEIRVVEGKIVSYEDGEIKEAAMIYLQRAKDAFNNKDYTEALRLAVKSNRILETGIIPEEKPRQIANPEMPVSPPPKREVVPIVEEDKDNEEELRCPNCGAVVRPEDKFCWNCGSKLVFTYTCPSCGAEVSSEDKFCRQCGYKLK